MPFRYSCFISYRHGQGPLLERFVADLEVALNSEILGRTGLPAFVDREMKGGMRLDSSLIGALRDSVCFIAVYTPTYFDGDHPYCAKEFRTMQVLETQRHAALMGAGRDNNGLIIPMVVRTGANGSVPSPIRKVIYYDFSQFLLWHPPLCKHRRYAKLFNEIGSYVQECHEALQSAGVAPEVAHPEIGLPTDDEIKTWIREVGPPRAPFPGMRAA